MYWAKPDAFAALSLAAIGVPFAFAAIRHPIRHGRRPLDHAPRPRIGQTRQPVDDRVLLGAFGEFVDERFERENIRHGAEAAQRRGTPRHFRHQMMDDPLGVNIVKRFAIACGAAAGGFRHVDRRRNGRRIGQRLGREQAGAAAGPALMRAAPDFGRPIHRMAGGVERGAHLDHHRRAHRLEREFLLPPPAHADRTAGQAQRDHCRIGGRVVGAIMAVAARPLNVAHRNRRGIELEHARKRRAQRIDALAVRPHRQMPIAIKRQRTRGRDRGMREMAARENRLVALQSARGIRFRRTDDAIDTGALQEPVRFLL